MRDENPDEPLQLQICSLDYSSYVGKIGIGRIRRGRIKAAQEVIQVRVARAVRDAEAARAEHLIDAVLL